ncbi:hypothetical protein PFICI_03972 [Pestalotiopsis fici W106-1]|uniref:FAD-binding PCMH-type domain-containing protein n=1 Tax=Pestalotiopsis fici (strain W106-1 / CGMCC3.15140) TaxID=1229662 RepID=W3XKF7_PESFW|nr:uncharacterized protein PFICI_03972 [Pestalotiopsis fici W106-1]ETS85947.1 hypothetical protein PFICI_03972 [Pestalotiopsis fici W106-1]
MTAEPSLSGARCLALLSTVGSIVFLPGHTIYTSSLSSYYSLASSSATPLCIVSPQTAQEVSDVLQVLITTANTLEAHEKSVCQFAIRSGGHLGFKGASNIDGGVTIDLRALNSINVNEGRTSTSVGTGATWDAVYDTLDPLGLSINGGRAAGVGVGGLTLGGGISYYSPRYGFTYDSASDFETVVANGSIIWGGMTYHPTSTLEGQIDVFVKLNSAESYDEYASQILIYAYTAVMDMVPVSLIVNEIEYTKPVVNPPVFEPVMSLSRYYSTMRLATMGELARDAGGAQAKGLCQVWATVTFESKPSMLNATYNLWQKGLTDVKSVSGLTWAISLDPLPPAIYAKGPDANSFGLSGRTKSLVVMLLTASFTHVSDQEKIEEVARNLVSSLQEEARKQDAFDPWVYLNYAASWQNPIASFGEASVKDLEDVRKRVDPYGIFTYNVPGGFKIHSSV